MAKPPGVVGQNDDVHARVIVLAGPSGAGKSRLAERLGLPVLRLDDFYKNGGDPTLPVISHGANAGLTDWDHPDSWLPDDALATLDALCREGRADVPVYDIAQDGRSGSQTLDLGGTGCSSRRASSPRTSSPAARTPGCSPRRTASGSTAPSPSGGG